MNQIMLDNKLCCIRDYLAQGSWTWQKLNPFSCIYIEVDVHTTETDSPKFPQSIT